MIKKRKIKLFLRNNKERIYQTILLSIFFTILFLIIGIATKIEIKTL